jgi:hypothetical protein
VIRDEIIQLLGGASCYDARKPSEGMVNAWSDAAERGRWTYPEATEAIKTHYVESTDFVMPAHVTKQIRAKRQDSAMRHPIDPPDRADQQRLAELIADAFQTIPDPRHDKWRVDAVSRPCPFCDFQPGEQCTRESPEGGVPTRIPHPTRMKPHEKTS